MSYAHNSTHYTQFFSNGSSLTYCKFPESNGIAFDYVSWIIFTLLLTAALIIILKKHP